MIITDELRRWAGIQVHETVSPMSGRAERELLAIADRIDVEHKAKVDEAYENGKRDERADWLDETDGGYIKLPVDADGVPIRVGDTIEIDHNGRVAQVDCITCWEENWMVCCSEGGMFDPKNTRCHHVQPDSWQRIIEDALHLQRGVHTLEYMQLVERCRRLAGEA